MTAPTFADWGSTGWRGIHAKPADHPGWNLPGFDDSAWPIVTLPLGSGGGCPIHSERPYVTFWPTGPSPTADSHYLLRRTFFGRRFVVDFVIDNLAEIYWDGTFVANGGNGWSDEDPCPARGQNQPASGDLGAGEHLLAVHCYDEGTENYFDCQVRLASDAWKIGAV